MTTKKDRQNDLLFAAETMADLEILATSLAVRAGVHRQRVLIEKSDIDGQISDVYESIIQTLQGIHQELAPVKQSLEHVAPKPGFFSWFFGLFFGAAKA
jgi:predicted regulator of amino acid metabolism with ACT domain